MSRLATIAARLRERLAEIGEAIRIDDSQESAIGGVLVSYGHRRLAEWRRAPEIVIVPVSSTISPSQSTRVVDEGGQQREKIADDVFEVELHIRTPRSDDPEADEERRDRLLYNTLTALGRSRLAPTVGAGGAFGTVTYPDEADFGVHALVAVIPFRTSLGVAACSPSTDLAVTTAPESPGTTITATVSTVDALEP